MLTYDSIDIKTIILNAYMIALYGFVGTMSVMISLFFKFHMILVFKNMTTLESIEKKGTNFESPYNVGKQRNWE